LNAAERLNDWNGVNGLRFYARIDPVSSNHYKVGNA
jgi:hypothetical protein